MPSLTHPSSFDSIRPFEPNELPEAFERLLADPQFRSAMAYVFPDIPFPSFAEKLRSCRTSMDVQKTFAYPFLAHLLETASKDGSMDSTAIDPSRRYTFVSNHRDIVLDSAFLAKFLIDNGFSTTCEIAIGDNLLSLPWVKDLVRVNKSFVVERHLPVRQMLEASKRLSAYMHYAISKKNENVWIAQREGRAKDSDDHTQQAVLKMMALEGEGDVIDRLKELHIVPLAISYEFDPCDYLKAQEMQLKRDVPGFKKSAQDDVVSMQTGILGYKGYVHYQCAPCLDGFLDTLDRNTPKADLFGIIARRIDREIFLNYRFYPNNFIACDLLADSHQLEHHYTPQDRSTFEQYVEDQLSKIDLPEKDEPFLRRCLLEMYANPYKNHLSAK